MEEGLKRKPGKLREERKISLVFLKVHKRKVIIIIALTFILLASHVFSAEEIKIGLSLGLTGRYSEMADMQHKGFLLWQKDVNSRGGTLGRKIKLIVHDDRSEAEETKRIYEMLIKDEEVDLLFAPYSSELTEAVAPVIEKYGYPVIVSGASSDRLWKRRYKNLFALYSPATNYTAGFLELILLKGFKDIAIIYADDSFSIEVAKGTKKWAERLGLKIILNESFKKGHPIPEEIIQEIRLHKPQVIIMAGHFDESIDMLRVFKKIRWYPRAYFASVGPVLEKFYKTAGKDAEAVFSASQWEHDNGMPESLEFYNYFIKTYRKEPSYHAAAAYGAGRILEEAIKRAGTIDRDKLREVLSMMDTVTLLGRYKVDSTGMQTKHLNLIIQWQKGKKKIVWPEDMANAKPIFRSKY